MSNVNNQFKELINEAIHNFFHDDTELEMILKDWLYGICEQASEYEAKAKAFDEIVEKYEGIMKGVRSRKFKVTSDVTLLGLEAEKVIKKYESGE